MNSVKNNSGTHWKRTIVFLFLAELVTAVGFSSIYPFLPLYVNSLGSKWGINLEIMAGLVFSAQAMTMMVASPVWGALADRYGRKIMVERAMFGGGVILFLMAFVRSSEELVLLRAAQGLITGTISAAGALAASVTPRDRTGFAMGVLQVGLGSGLALGPLIGGPIADAYGYSAAFYVTGVMLVIAGLLVLFGVKEQFDSNRNGKEMKNIRFIDEWKNIINEKGVKTAYAMRFSSQLGRMMIMPIAPLFIVSLLEDSSHAGSYTGIMFGIMSGFTTLSAFFLGRLGDRIGHRKIVVFCVLTAAVLYVPQYFIQYPYQLIVLQAMAGICMGGILPAVSALLAGYTQIGEEGAVFGIDNSVNAAARALAPLIGSAVSYAFGMRYVFIACALTYLAAGGLAVWLLPERRIRKNTT